MGLLPVISTGYLSIDLLLLLGGGFWAHHLFRTWQHLSHIPGPFLWSMSPLPMLQANLGGYSHKSLSDLSARYGPLVRIGPNSVLTTDFRHCQKMEGHKSPYRKGPWYGTFRFQKGKEHSFAMMDEEKHTKLRTKVGPGYSGTAMVVSIHSSPCLHHSPPRLQYISSHPPDPVDRY
jgi:hypothetical protein